MDDREFRTAMGRFATGITVVTSLQDNQPRGMTANAFMSVSLNPKLVLVSISNRAKMNACIQQTGRYGVSVLAESQKEVAMTFAGQLSNARSPEFAWMDGLPVLSGSLVTLACNVVDAHLAGDHTLFIGEVTSLNIQSGQPLLFFSGQYSQLPVFAG
ncbi:MAG: flavin reductase family protein [Alicyclobacillus herbarius]|uniref:flavin reductase family protein n=1 Tax=Alicyclobacillus herbarius TaxID=122960 RepID=UPI002356AD93|nr:flavin reductase family protein [Alicyclobacillus herbarius]MCL6631828.1 flavin reductase family protein [Alicyclobacillus herbarius]